MKPFFFLGGGALRRLIPLEVRVLILDFSLWPTEISVSFLLFQTFYFILWISLSNFALYLSSDYDTVQNK